MTRFKKYAALAAALLCSAATLSAQNTSTPYSMYGYGILNDNATNTQRQMGGIGYAMSSGRQINVMNPASYAAIDSMTFLFDFGADISFINSQEGSAKAHQTGGGLDYITMQFPLSKHFGASVGMLPYSSVGYAFGNEIKFGTLSNQGSGGITQAYIGLGATYYGVSLGVNASYNWGNIINDTYAATNTGITSLFEHVLQVRDFNVNFGAMYTLFLDKNAHKVSLGATYQPKKSLHGNTWGAYWDINSDAKADTVGYSTMAGKYYQPNTIGAGLSYTYHRNSHIMAEIDYMYQDWSKAKYEPLLNDKGDVVFQGMTFDNRWRVSAGAEYIPKLRGNYLQRITYRLGGHYTHDYLLIHGNNVRDYGLSCGVGLPTLEGRTLINIGFEWKHRNAAPQKLISENYFNITVGINFNEMWFWQRKLK